MTQREWLVIGSSGQLGREILVRLGPSRTRLQAVSRAEPKGGDHFLPVSAVAIDGILCG